MFQKAAKGMKRVFATVVALDVLLLAIPTRWMSPMAEFWCAATLALVTALLWLCLKLSYEE